MQIRSDETFFDYQLDKSLVALLPPSLRGGSRLLVANRSKQSICSKRFPDIIDYMLPGDLLILNDTKVFSAKLTARKFVDGVVSEHSVEILLEKRISCDTWKVLTTIKNKNPVKVKIYGNLDNSIEGEVFQDGGESKFLRFERVIEAREIESLGHMPIPPYIEKLRDEKSFDTIDRENYQTVYANKTGSIAAPTAGFHFSNEILKKLEKKGIEIAYITLHVGYSTFKPIRTDIITDHKMGLEEYFVSPKALSQLRRAKKEKRRIISVGTTSTRVLESVAEDITDNHEKSFLEGNTGLFIYPGYKFKMVDLLVTNFHLPKSTLLLLVTSFGGSEFIKQAYEKAIEEKFLFYSYGDSMIITP